ncbi:MAG: hypothetical protein HXK77_08480 [Lachnospiraceae bacterium]|nr:hypothetical protein [Lachnospiraceae bacterium]
MGFFDELGKKISDASQDMMQKGKDFADTTKLNSQIHDEERKISAVYTKIGKKYFEEFHQAAGAGYQDLVDEIHASQAKISEYQDKLNALKAGVEAQVDKVKAEAEEVKDEAVKKAESVKNDVVEGAENVKNDILEKQNEQ